MAVLESTVRVSAFVLSLLLHVVVSSSLDVMKPDVSDLNIPEGIEVKTFSAYSKPLPLYPGEVTNTFHRLTIPKGPIAIYEFQADVVERDFDTGEYVPVPLSDAYLHHHVALSDHSHYRNQHHWWSPMKPKHHPSRGFGFGAGTESRGTKQRFPFPFAFTTVKGEDDVIANAHIINTRSMDIADAHHCLECPCTTVDVYSTNGTILASVANRTTRWNRCNLGLLEEHNTACFPQTYHGGLICCEHGEFCLDQYDLTMVDNTTTNIATNKQMNTNITTIRIETPTTTITRSQSIYYLRYTLSYSEIVPENRPLFLGACCDATGNITVSGNVEYDIPQLCPERDAGDDDTPLTQECIHEATAIQMLHGFSDIPFGGSNKTDVEVLDVVYMIGHLHRGGLEVVAYDNETGDIICNSTPTYGTGAKNEIGNEPGYINSMSACTFDPPLRLKSTQLLKIVGRYDATQNHTGVMSLFYVAVAQVPGEDGVGNMEQNKEGFFAAFQPLAVFVALVIILAAIVMMQKKYSNYGPIKRWGYERVPNNNHGQSLTV